MSRVEDCENRTCRLRVCIEYDVCVLVKDKPPTVVTKMGEGEITPSVPTVESEDA